MTVRLRSRALLLVFALFAVIAALPPDALAQTPTVTTLYTFPGTSYPIIYGPLVSGLVQGSDGNFYGTTVYGGTYDKGSVFKITPAGEITVLYSFCSVEADEICRDGAEPNAALTQGSDGNFYGTTSVGGYGYQEYGLCDGCGTVFTITPSGTLTTLHSFCIYGPPYDECPDGADPAAGLVQGSDGNLYGTTSQGGAAENGTTFKISLSGNLATLNSFGGGVEGGFPISTLIQGPDGNYYGTTEYTIYNVTSSGTVTTLANMDGSGSSYGTDYPYAGLVQGGTGSFYGTTIYGGNVGSSSCGKPGCSFIYGITSSGTLTTLYTFCSAANCSDGNEIYSGLVIGSDGNFYGTTYGSGQYGAGTVFKMTLAGSLTTLYAFTGGTDSGLPGSALIQASDGSLYGTTSGYYDDGTRHDDGTVYKLSFSTPLAPPVQLTLSDSTVEAGTPVTLTWTVSNAFSMTLQQCHAFVQNGATGAGTWTGLQAGKIVSGVYTGSASITPTAAGTYTYALTCGGQESGFATLTVTSSPGSITFSSTTHNFGSVIDGTSAAAYGVKLTNPNSTIFPFTMNLSGASAFTQVNNCGTEVAAGGTCEIVFYFKPTSTGAQTATWNLTANGETFSPSNGGTLSGTGVNDGSLSLTTSVHNFGDQTVGTTSGVYGTVLTNSYAFPVTLAFSTTGNTADFTTTANNCGTTLRANASCNLQYEFSPKAKGFLTETMGITATYDGSPVTIMSLGSPVTGVVLKGTGE